MTLADDAPSIHLRRVVASDLLPVHPLRPPLQRALALLPLAVVLVLAQPLLLGVRHDAAQLGPLLLWGLSLGQCVLGSLLVVAALREAVPGRGLRFSPALLVLGAVVCVAVTYATWSHSMTRVPLGHFTFFWRICFAGPVVLGLPVVVVALWMAVRAYPLRPALTGALAGLGVGLWTDAGWRMFCHVSDPRHVLSAHAAAVLVMCVAGALLAPPLARRRM